MTNPAGRSRPYGPGWARALQIFGLSGFAVAQPLLDLVGRNPTFLVAHRVTATDVAILVVVVTVAVPSVLLGAEAAVQWLAPRAAFAVHAGIVGTLGAVVALPVIDRAGRLPWLLAPVVAVIVASVLAVVYRRSVGARAFLTVLGPAPLIFVLLFVTVSPARSVIGPDRSATVGATGVRAAPVFFIVFDQLPLGHLMDSNGEIAEARFPNFARLSRVTTWFRNATVVHPYTEKSVPAILSGRLPAKDDTPTLQDWPQNLFTLLQSSHEMDVREKVTDLCPPQVCDDPPARAGEGLRALLVDSGVAYLHAALPESWRHDLPPIDDRWGGFTKPASAADREAGECDPDPEGVTTTFDEWLDAAWSGEPPTLHFLHVLVPHRPWRYLPTGHVYDEGRIAGFAYKSSVWGDDARLVDRALQQQVLQLAYVDTLIGRFLDRLEREGLLEPAAIVVTSDHGMAFTPGEHVRRFNKAIYDEAARVPLFFKGPGQTRGEVSDENVESIDIVPTLADVLGFSMPEAVDGQSMVDPSAPSRPEKFVAGGTPNFHWPADLNRGFPIGVKMDRLFGRGTDQLGLFAMGPNRDLVGQRSTSVATDSTTSWRGELAEPRAFGDIDPAVPCVPARVDGTIQPAHQGDVAVALNGTIAGVGPAFSPQAGHSKFSVMVRPDLFRAGDNEVELFVVSGVGEDRVLEPVATS